ncbi:MAG: Gfo/Idh/MocA family oxidoreductase [Phycisphaerae bacterium]|nr:Gfo/Idh/MocA family oxidoreductase [Phycisphaerae bacterium]
MKDIGVGIIGSGFMGTTYSETLAKYCSGAKLVAVTGGSRAAELAKRYGMDCEADAKKLIARDDIDAIIIATPHHTHAEYAVPAAKAGKHLLLEKPMAATVADCDAINAACKASGVNCAIAFTQRFRKCNIVAKRLIDEGRLGRILQINERALNAGGLGGLPAWQNTPENLGTLFGHGVHNLDRIRWFTGREVERVYARCGSIEPDVKVEGTSMLLLTLDNGVAASVSVSFQMPKPSFPRSQFSAWIVGERGLMDVDAYGELRIADRGGQWEVVETQAPIDWAGQGFLDPVRIESYTAHMNDFLDSIREKRPPMATGHDGRQAVAIALAAYESSRTHTEVKFV